MKKGKKHFTFPIRTYAVDTKPEKRARLSSKEYQDRTKHLHSAGTGWAKAA